MKRYVLLFATLLLALALASVALAVDNPPPLKEEPAPNTSSGTADGMTAAPAPEAVWPGPDGFGYLGESIAYNWVDISTSGTPIAITGDDASSGALEIGFTFPYYGVNYTQFYAQTNGTLAFGAATIVYSNQCPLPNSTTPNNVLPIVWDDLNMDAQAFARYQTFGTCPVGPATQCLVASFHNMDTLGGSTAGTWEAILYPTGDIYIQFQDVGTAAGGSSTTGIEGNNAASDHGLTYVCNATNSLAPNTAIHLWVPPFGLSPAYQEGVGCNCGVQDHSLVATNNELIPVTVVFTYTAEGVGEVIGPPSVAIPPSSSAPVPIDVRLSACNQEGETLTVTVEAFVLETGSTSTATIVKHSAGPSVEFWTPIATEPNNGRMDNVVAGYNGYAWSIAGYGANTNVRYYDPALDTWTSLVPAGSVPPNNYARSGCNPTTGAAMNQVFVYGDAAPSFTGLRSYNMDTNTWTALTPGGTPPVQTGIWAPAWVYDPLSGYCYMTGGASTPGAGNLTTVYVYDPVGNAWMTPLPNFTSVRDFHAAFVYDRPVDSHHMLCVVGGNNGAGMTSTQCYDFTASAWNAENADIPALPGTLWGMGYTYKWHLGTQHQLWLLGGVDVSGAATTTTMYFDVGSGTWVVDAPYGGTGTYRGSATTVNNEIYKLGGSTSGFTYTGLAWHHIQLVCPGCSPFDEGVKIAPPEAVISDTITYSFAITPTAIEMGMFAMDPLPPEVSYAGNLTYTWGYAWYDAGENAVIWTPPFLPLLNETEAATFLPFEGTLPEDAVDTVDANSAPVYEPAAPSPFAIINSVLWDNGPLVTHVADCSGVDASRLQNVSLGLTIYGFGHQVVNSNRVADDFFVDNPLGWDVDNIVFFAYQTGSPTNPSTINHVNYQIWDGPPGQPGSNIVFGDTTTNRLVDSIWANMYRDYETTTCGTTRPVMADTTSGGFHLPPGHYWVDWQTGGTLSSGPWAPPISIIGQTVTGDGLQSLAGGAYNAAMDGSYQQGFPFVIIGSAPQIQVTFDVTLPFVGQCDYEVFNEVGAFCGDYNQFFGAATHVVGFGELEITAGDLHAYHLPDMQSTMTMDIANTGICSLDFAIWEMPATLHKITSKVDIKPRFTTPPPGAELIQISTPGSGTPSPTVVEPEAMLWDQPSDGRNAIIDQYFPDFGAGVFSADDFSAPDSWAITRISVEGLGWYPGSLLYAESLNWYIYTDAAGVPAGYPGGGGEIWSFTAVPNDTFITIYGPNFSSYILDIVAATGAPLILPPGDYWLASYPSLNFSQYSQWFWNTSATINGSTAQYIDPDGLIGPPGTWTPWTSIDPLATDAAFRLEGYPYYDIPWLSENPTMGSLAPGETIPVELLFDSTGLTSGDYFGNLDVESSDPDEPITTLPVALTVMEPAVHLDKSVGLTEATCQDTDIITVTAGTEVVYCYEMFNDGDATLNSHDLLDDHLGVLLDDDPTVLAPGESMMITETAVINEYTLNNAYYTATTEYGGFEVSAPNAAIVNVINPAIELTKTVGTDPGVCATTDAINVPVGTEVTYCFTVFNSGDITLTIHDLSDDVLGDLFAGFGYELGPGDSYSFLETVVVTEDVTNTATWTAWVEEGGYFAEATDTATVTTYIPFFYYYVPIVFK